jgi:hypothetical protein
VTAPRQDEAPSGPASQASQASPELAAQPSTTPSSRQQAAVTASRQDEAPSGPASQPSQASPELAAQPTTTPSSQQQAALSAPQQGKAGLATTDSCVTNIDSGTGQPCGITPERKDIRNTTYPDGTTSVVWTLRLYNTCSRQSLSATIHRDGRWGNEEVLLGPGETSAPYKCSSYDKCTKMSFSEHCTH